MEDIEEQQIIDNLKSQLDTNQLLKEIDGLKFHPLFTEDKNVLSN